ncbi:sugar transferase [Novosphingobium flavum]|uniref:Sugar transferase n=1 Tax=Novosphingobium flavum TaxID=1778672 RepID=A0A7X1FPB0_9SPHN|nr:sugar transferase [Novosphingobium flavum]MBC2664460.1 sugar transferase [Novosphingobium flavum]
MPAVKAVPLQRTVLPDILEVPALERRRLQCYIALMCGDIAMLLGVFVCAGWLYTGTPGIGAGLILAQLLMPAFLTIALYNGAYSRRALEDAVYGGVRAVLALVISSAVVMFIAFYTKTSQEFSRVSFTASALGAVFLLPWCRAQLRLVVIWRCGHKVLNELVIHDGGPDINLPGVRHIDAARYALIPELADPVALDRIGSVLRNVDRVIISCQPERRQAWALILKGANIEGEVIDDAIVALGARGARQAGGRGLLLVSLGPLGLRARAVKRLFDLAVAGSALLCLFPLLAVTALLIKLEDRGPVFFVQRRMGRGNTFFSMYKFRSMRVARLDHDGAQSAARDDERVTRVGRFIRRTSIDELPQLFNVLFGDMSIVGPRPHAIGSQAGDKLFWEVDKRYWLRHALKPGLTGLAQIRGFRGATEHESDLASRLNADLEYLNGWSPLRDFAIMVATARVLVHDRAY